LSQINVDGETVSYTYDSAGNVTRRQSGTTLLQHIYWNALGQLHSVKTVTGSGITTEPLSLRRVRAADPRPGWE
jgi:hypothetical protein